MRYLGQEDEAFLQDGWVVCLSVDIPNPQAHRHTSVFGDKKAAVLALWSFFKDHPELECESNICSIDVSGEQDLEVGLYFENRQAVQNAVKEYL